MLILQLLTESTSLHSLQRNLKVWKKIITHTHTHTPFPYKTSLGSLTIPINSIPIRNGRIDENMKSWLSYCENGDIQGGKKCLVNALCCRAKHEIDMWTTNFYESNVKKGEIAVGVKKKRSQDSIQNCNCNPNIFCTGGRLLMIWLWLPYWLFKLSLWIPIIKNADKTPSNK